MSSFILTISNPAIKTTSLNAPTTASALPNTAFVGLPGGNDIDLNVSNKSGETLTFGTASTGDLLLLQVSKKIMDDTGASKLGAVPPWSLRIPNSNDQDPPSDDTYYNFYLYPSADVSIDDGKSGKISLTDLEPSVKGSGFLQLHFTSNTQDPFTIYDQLITCGSPQQDLPYLLSDETLKPYVYINTKESTPIIVSDLPVTDGNKVENIIQVRFVLQASSGSLISSWSNLPKPTFQISFPYSRDPDTPATEYDLTDCLMPGNGYNETTSARNIVATVQYPYKDPNTPPLSDTFWQITQVGGELDTTDLPGWVITPQASNQTLFSSLSKKDLDAGPGPELDIWLSHIFSGLPISQCDSSLIYLHWHDFPGFNDGVYILPLTKELLTIDSFAITIDEEGPQVNFQWQAHASTYSVDGTLLTGTTYAIPLSPSLPMRSTYTLTATASNAITQLSQTLCAQWHIDGSSFNNGSPGKVYMSPMDIFESVDSQLLAVRSQPADPNAGLLVRFADLSDLGSTSIPPIKSNGLGVTRAALAPNGYTLYWTDEGSLNSYDMRTRAPIPGSVPANYTDCFFLGFAPNGDGEYLVVTCDLTTIKGRTFTLNTYSPSLQPVSSNKFPVPGCYLLRIGPKGTIFAATPTSLIALDSGLNTIATNPFLTGIGQIVPSTDNYVYTLSVDILKKNGILSKLDATTLKIIKQVATPVIWDPVDLVLYGPVNASLILSADGSQLILVGIDGEKLIESQGGSVVPLFLVYDSDTLEQPAWAVGLQTEKLEIVNDLKLSVFGHRIYGACMNFSADPDFLFWVDASFPSPSETY